MADVFISYKSERRAAAEHLAEILASYGYSVWWDYGLISGREFGAQIERELRASKAVVVLWCSRSRDSEWVLDEADVARRLNKAIPTMIEKVELPLGWGRSQTLDLSEWDGAPQSHQLERLLHEIGRLVERAPTPNLESLDNMERAWRRYGAPSLREFALTSALEDKILPRTLPGRLSSQGGEPQASRPHKGSKRRRFVLYSGVVLAVTAIAILGHLVLSPRAPVPIADQREAASTAALALQGEWRLPGDTDCTNLAVSGNALTFTGPMTIPFPEDIVRLDEAGAVQTDVAGTPAFYRLDGEVLLFTYGSGGTVMRYQRCTD